MAVRLDFGVRHVNLGSTPGGINVFTLNSPFGPPFPGLQDGTEIEQAARVLMGCNELRHTRR